MKNYLVITLGTREVQLPLNKIEENNFEVIEEKGERFTKFFVQKINDSSVRIEVRQPSKEFPDFYTISPRTTGKIIDDNYDLFRPIIDFPIVRPALEYLKQKEVNLDVIMLVYTDQEEAFKSGKVKFQNKENDSIYYADIISKLIKEDVFFAKSEIDQFTIIDNVTDLGFQYDDFKRINVSLLYPDEVKQVFLYPQGGIDQINQALILRLIETFKGKVKQLQKAEGADFKELDFPSKFLGSLNKQKIIKHLTDYDFGAITVGSKTITCLAQYANKRLNLDYGSLKAYTNIFKQIQYKNEILDFPIDNHEKLKDLYLSAKIYYKQGKLKDFLWRIFTVFENYTKVPIEKRFGDTDWLRKKEFEWKEYLKKIDINLIEHLQNTEITIGNFKQKLDFSYPNRHTFWHIYFYLNMSKNEAMERKLYQKTERLSDERNKIAHSLDTITEKELNEALGKEYNCSMLISDLDQIFNIQGFGIYDKIKEEIEALL